MDHKAIQSAIYKMWRVKIAVRTIDEYEMRWGFTPQKPIKKAYKQSTKAVQDLLDTSYPEIKKLANAENVEIYWSDETGVQNDCQHSRGYAPRGQTHAKLVKAWLERHQENIEVFYLPSYSPEINPDEY